jgi:gamma-glutamyltransferase 2. Threonine peptidase. MEROPS family T03
VTQPTDSEIDFSSDELSTNPDLDKFDSRRSTMYAHNGIVATSQPLAAQAGIQLLRNGGNAFDAAVATAATLNVVEPMSTGIGGDVFAMYRTAEGDVGAMRSCGGAPAAATRETVRNRVDSNTPTMPASGPLAVTVPGTVRGWERLLMDHGRYELNTTLEPAITYASEGYPVSEIIASAWARNADVFVDTVGKEAFHVSDGTPSVGDVIRLPHLAETFETIAEGSADAFYEGPLATQIATAVRDRGGLLEPSDLADFEAEYVDPVSTTYRGTTVYELPPNNQGLIALEALNIASEIDAGSYAYDSADRIHYYAESLKRAFHDGHHYITDPTFESVPDLAASSHAVNRAKSIDERASDVSVGGPGMPPEESDTVLLTVADKAGNVVSLINSIFGPFGSGVVVPDTGIVLQNRGASFTLDPSHPNALEPKKRPFHTLIPGLIQFDSDDWAAFGVMGGYMQPQGHLQVLANLIDYGFDPQAALNAPRWRYCDDGSLAIEERFADGVLGKLARRGHDVTVRPPSAFGGAQFTRRRGDVLSGATDPRKDGAAIGF